MIAVNNEDAQPAEKKSTGIIRRLNQTALDFLHQHSTDSLNKESFELVSKMSKGFFIFNYFHV